jgi:hypothetical protein
VIRLDLDRFVDLRHRKHRAVLQKVRQVAFVLRREMENDHVGQSTVFADAPEKFAQCADSAGRCTKADYKGIRLALRRL